MNSAFWTHSYRNNKDMTVCVYVDPHVCVHTRSLNLSTEGPGAVMPNSKAFLLPILVSENRKGCFQGQGRVRMKELIKVGFTRKQRIAPKRTETCKADEDASLKRLLTAKAKTT